MKLNLVDQIVNAVLYEGYVLYPYRPSAVKNQRRFNFGVLVPAAYSERQGGSEISQMRTECLVCGDEHAALNVRVRFLQVTPSPTWQEAVERESGISECQLGDLAEDPRHEEFRFAPLQGSIDVTATALESGLYRVAVQVANLTGMPPEEPQNRDEVLPYSLASTHIILSVTRGEFVSLLDPPDGFRNAASACRNEGTWPVLVGEAGDRDVILASPIILYDYPQIAPESPGNLFDGCEIDEILSLRVLTMTDAEKSEIREAGGRAREILERTESLSEEQLMKLHGALRGLHPPPKGDS